MTETVERINSILDDLENRSDRFVDNVLNAGGFDIEAAGVTILTETGGRAYFLQKPNGLPLWFDLTLIAHAAPRERYTFDFAVFDYHVQYRDLRERHLRAANAGEVLSIHDAIEALLLAELCHDDRAADTLIEWLGQEIPESGKELLPLLNRGNARIRSVIGRTLALNTDEATNGALFAYLNSQEQAEGVRADIIMTYIRANAAKGRIPKPILTQVLSATNIVDPLSCVIAVAAIGKNMSSELLSIVAEENRSALHGWFSS